MLKFRTSRSGATTSMVSAVHPIAVALRAPWTAEGACPYVNLAHCPNINGSPFFPLPITTIFALGLLARFSVASMPFHSSS